MLFARISGTFICTPLYICPRSGALSSRSSHVPNSSNTRNHVGLKAGKPAVPYPAVENEVLLTFTYICIYVCTLTPGSDCGRWGRRCSSRSGPSPWRGNYSHVRDRLHGVRGNFSDYFTRMPYFKPSHLHPGKLPKYELRDELVGISQRPQNACGIRCPLICTCDRMAAVWMTLCAICTSILFWHFHSPSPARTLPGHPTPSAFG